jgi:hypothetical protein
MIDMVVVSSNFQAPTQEWPPTRTLNVLPHNQAKMYTALVESSAQFYEFKYTILNDIVVFTFRANNEDYVALKLAYGT